MHNPLVVAVVLNWNDPNETIECVKSLLESSYNNLKVVIVDNASSDNSVEIFSGVFPAIPILPNSHNAGYAGGNNLGITWALNNNANFVLILNNDVTVDKQLINELLVCIQKDKTRGVVSGKVFYKNDTERIFSGAGKFIRWRCTGVNRGSTVGRLYQHNKECLVDYVSGVLFLTRAEVFKTLGLLDERYFMYFEDLEFSRRVSARFSIVYTPTAIAYHKSGGGTRWSNYSEVYLYYQTRNRFLVFETEPLYYRAYVAIFTILVTVAKSVAVLSSFAEHKSDVIKRCLALWRGLRDGVWHFIFKRDFVSK